MNKDNEVDDYAKFPHLKARAEHAKSIIPEFKYYDDFVAVLNETNKRGWPHNYFGRSFAWLLEHAEPLNFYYTYAEWVIWGGRMDPVIEDCVIYEIAKSVQFNAEYIHPKMRKKLEEEHLLEAPTAAS
jgi:hypothetical protein